MARWHWRHLGSASAIAVAMAAPAAAQGPKLCGTPPDTYICPPPPPPGIRFRDAEEREQFRIQLEDYRRVLERMRERRPERRDSYDLGIKAYREGMADYRSAKPQ